MKKTIAILLCCAAFFTGASRILFAAPKPSLDGRAVVADPGVLPKGAYGKSIGYLPGDSVTVTNPAAGVSIDVMILGVIDSTEGIAILLSPEAADSLFITKDSQALVTVTKKGMFDGMPETAADTRTVKADPDKDALKAIPDAIAQKFDRASSAAEQPYPVLPPVLAPATETRTADRSVIAASETTAGKDTSVARSPSVPPQAAELGENYEWIWSGGNTPPDTAVTEEPKPEIVYIDLLPERPGSAPLSPESPAVGEPIPGAPAINEGDVPKGISSAGNGVPQKNSPPAGSGVPQKNSPPAGNGVPQTNGSPAGSGSPLENGSALESIVLLVPSDPKPPVPQEPSRPITLNPQPTSPVVPAAPNPAANSPAKASSAGASEKPAGGTFAAPSSVKRVQSLERGKYYVQIATFSSAESVQAVAVKFGEKYPLVQIVNDAAKSSQVLVGPLTADEYGAVLAHFREYGYKDAFLRSEK
jgi:hypothetical protein